MVVRFVLRSATDNTVQAHLAHQAFDGAAGDVVAFPLQLPPDLPRSVDAAVLFPINVSTQGIRSPAIPGGSIFPLVAMQAWFY
jgi:hypothetical protein